MSGSIFDVKDFGAIGDGITDDYPAFRRALDAIAALSKISRIFNFPPLPSITEVKDPRGSILFVPFGQYKLSQTLHITRKIVIQGVGSAGSRLIFPPDIDGIVVHSLFSSPAEDDTQPIAGGHGTGAGTVIRDIVVQSDASFGFPRCPDPAINEDDPLTADPVLHSGHPIVSGSGIVLFAAALIENCNIL